MSPSEAMVEHQYKAEKNAASPGPESSRSASSKARALFVSYNSLIEPLGPTQILPYIRMLASDYRMTVLSFEKPVVRTPAQDAQDRAQLQSRLAEEGIEWIQLRYHKAPSLAATVYDILTGVVAIGRAHRRRRFDLVHARGYVPGAMAWAAHRLFGVPYVFDIRALHVQEYLDAGHWDTRSLAFRLTSGMEQRMLHDAAGIVTLTEAVRPHLRQFPGMVSRKAPPVWEVIPCCADLERFRFRPEKRAAMRKALGLGQRPVLVYSGSFGSLYLIDEMIDFYKVARGMWPGLFFLMLGNGPPGPFHEALKRHGVDTADSVVRSGRFEEMPDYLSAADAAIAFALRCPSKIASSPSKHGEYLACGLPIAMNAGIGDADALVERDVAGVLVREFTRDAYARAAHKLRELVEQGRQPSRAIAEERFSLQDFAGPAYRRLYRNVLSDSVPTSG
jgi:glycosyltransferase involved in cell wall biosynthesis